MTMTNRLSDLERDILTCLGIVGATDVDDIADILGASPRAVQDALIKLAESEHVLMRNGWYRLSEASKAGRI